MAKACSFAEQVPEKPTHTCQDQGAAPRATRTPRRHPPRVNADISALRAPRRLTRAHRRRCGCRRRRGRSARRATNTRARSLHAPAQLCDPPPSIRTLPLLSLGGVASDRSVQRRGATWRAAPAREAWRDALTRGRGRRWPTVSRARCRADCAGSAGPAVGSGGPLQAEALESRHAAIRCDRRSTAGWHAAGSLANGWHTAGQLVGRM
eukprot:364334-Chlamydomonas_euryale.AAC.4